MLFLIPVIRGIPSTKSSSTKFLYRTHVNSIAVAAHPGVSSTNLERYARGKVLFWLGKPLLPLIHQDAATGALPEIRAAVDPEVRGGEYYGPGG